MKLTDDTILNVEVSLEDGTLITCFCSLANFRRGLFIEPTLDFLQIMGREPPKIEVNPYERHRARRDHVCSSITGYFAPHRCDTCFAELAPQPPQEIA